ncbi:hypothetical protein M378DRAFT_960420 [Amanita muscaria Koide BX008]|uniref:Uncharacterized protein n=1 Tax=Amanita muscaria (strain Koide BX008) TaxID=946122 RepID=A0A0C2T0T7_AMAMK|nr:hypothetical protein M378DRAFT_960420 [Amanita muscaria Koide BX008]
MGVEWERPERGGPSVETMTQLLQSLQTNNQNKKALTTSSTLVTARSTSSTSPRSPQIKRKTSNSIDYWILMYRNGKTLFAILFARPPNAIAILVRLSATRSACGLLVLLTNSAPPAPFDERALMIG